MPISLGPVSKIQQFGSLTAGFRLSGSAAGDGISYDSGVASMSAQLRLQIGGWASGGSVTPEMPGVASLNAAFGGSGTGFLRLVGAAAGNLAVFGGKGYAASGAFTSEGFMDAGFQFGGYAEELADSENYGFFVDRMPVMLGLSGIEYEFIDDTLEIDQTQRGNATAVLMELARLRTPARATFEGLASITSKIGLGDRLSVIARMLLDEGFSLAGDATGQRTAVERVIDGLMLAGVATSVLEAISAVVAGVAFLDMAQLADQEALEEGFQLAGDPATVVEYAARLVETLLLDAAGEGLVTMVAVVSDGIALQAGTDAVAQLVALLQEGVSFALHMDLDDGRYSAYTINTESKAVTQYSNYPFNSFAKLGGRYFGMTPDGIRELEGDTDAGGKIAARFRMAMTNLGTGRMKRMVAAYLGYTATGGLMLKTITTATDGKKEAYHYRLLPQPASAPREARIKIGQGLRSVYWGFEVQAIDGAQFHIDVLNLYPIFVEGRIQGQGGSNR